MGRGEHRLVLAPGLADELGEGHVFQLGAGIELVLPGGIHPDRGGIPEREDGKEDGEDGKDAGHGRPPK